MRIDPFELPLAEPFETAGGRLDRRRGFVVRVDHGETRGVGEATPMSGFTESDADCESALDRAADIAADDGLEAAHDAIDAARTPAAAHGLSLAILDANARTAGQPLYRLLGGDRCDSVPVNATVGDCSPSPTASAARAAVDAGYDTVKVKVGVRSPAADVERLRAVREAVGDRVAIRADANGAWTRSEAETVLDGTADLDLAYVEQPLPADDLDGHAALREGPVPIALDESLVENALETILAAGAADAVVLKPMALGSPAAARATAAAASTAGLTVAVTTTFDAVVARTAAVHVAASLPSVAPSGLATTDALATDLAPDPAPVSDGRIEVPQGPGTGVEGVST